MQSPSKKVLRVLRGETLEKPPIWLMRQAGRYLPEYREIRATAPSFIEFCFTPKKASEVTLQPIRRFGFDAAILFSDILVIPEALGQKVSFETGEGPRLAPISEPSGMSILRDQVDISRLSAVFETIQIVKGALDDETTFLGFCGAPWTVASYMIAGRGTPDQAPARLFAYRYPAEFQRLIQLLVQSSIDYLVAQFHAGIDAAQIFDSWSGVLPQPEFERWCLHPLRQIVEGVRERVPGAPIIAFPRSAASYLAEVSAIPGIAAIGLDTSTGLDFARGAVSSPIALQGNLDPLALITGGSALGSSVDHILEKMRGRPHVFNLGHGILPQTPVQHVYDLVKKVRNS